MRRETAGAVALLGAIIAWTACVALIWGWPIPAGLPVSALVVGQGVILGAATLIAAIKRR